MAVDWGFISGKDIEGEAEHLTGYVPAKGSGFTVGSFDIGQHSKEDVRRIIQSYQNKLGKTYPLAETTELYQKISPYALREDVSDIEAREVDFRKEDIEYLTEAKRYEFEKSISTKEFKNLSEKKQTILASVGWQYGTDSDEYKELYKLKDSEGKMISKLVDMGGAGYKHRRLTEAKYLDPVFLDMLVQENPIGYRE